MAEEPTLDLQNTMLTLLQADRTEEMLAILEEYVASQETHQYAMYLAAQLNKRIVFQWLIERSSYLLNERIDFEPTLSYGDKLMFISCRNGALDTVRLLVESCGVRVDTSFDGHEQEPLAKACNSGNAELVRYLLERGAKPNITTVVGQVSFPLLHAASVGNVAVARVLVEHGAAVNGLNPFGLPPLSYAIMKGHAEMIAYLRSVGGLEPWQLRGESGPPEPEPPPLPKRKPKKSK